MKKRIFKFGAALTAALMICSATAGLAFADEIYVETPETTEPAAVETVDEAAPEEEAVEDETPAEEAEAPVEEAEDTEEVVIPLETKTVTVDEYAEAAADEPTGSSVITIGSITSQSDDSYYTVSVPFTAATVPSQMTLFVYNITNILANGGDGFVSVTETPVGYINQYDGAASGTYTFKLSKTGDNAYKDGDTIMVKIGGTDVATPDAESYTLGAGGDQPGPGPEVMYGDSNGDNKVNPADAALVMKYARGKMTESDKIDLEAADVNGDTKVNPADAALIMQHARGKINTFPVEQ